MSRFFRHRVELYNKDLIELQQNIDDARSQGQAFVAVDVNLLDKFVLDYDKKLEDIKRVKKMCLDETIKNSDRYCEICRLKKEIASLQEELIILRGKESGVENLE